MSFVHVVVFRDDQDVAGVLPPEAAALRRLVISLAEVWTMPIWAASSTLTYWRR